MKDDLLIFPARTLTHTLVFKAKICLCTASQCSHYVLSKPMNSSYNQGCRWHSYEMHWRMERICLLIALATDQ